MSHETTKQRILEAADRESASWTELLVLTDVSKPTLFQHLTELQERGLMAKNKLGQYVTTEKGFRALEASTVSAAIGEAVAPPAVEKTILGQVSLRIIKSCSRINACRSEAEWGRRDSEWVKLRVYDSVFRITREIPVVYYRLADSLEMIPRDKKGYVVGGWAENPLDDLTRRKEGPEEILCSYVTELENAAQDFIEEEGKALPHLAKYIDRQMKRLRLEYDLVKSR